MGTGIFSNDIDERLDALADDAIVSAAVTGSLGASSSIEYDGVKDTVRVERVALHAAGWRVAHVTVADQPKYTHSLIGKVLVRGGNPGQYPSHELDDLDQAIADELAEAPQPEAEEDYLRALLHNEDI